MVWIQSWVDTGSLGKRQPSGRLDRSEYNAGERYRNAGGDALHVDGVWQTGRFHDGKRLPGWLGCDYCAERIREPDLLLHYRPYRRSAGMPLRLLRRTHSQSGRSGRRGVGSRNMWNLGRHIGGFVRRRQKQLRRLLERCERQRHGIILRRRFTVGGTAHRVATLLGFVFTLSFIIDVLVDVIIGQRASAKSEFEGLDLPEIGALPLSGI
jgi:hypothetical protein